MSFHEGSSAWPKALVIAGQTASGKSALANALAQRIPIEIISADSVQVFVGFDVGSAKPTQKERAVIPHHLIDVAQPSEHFDAQRFAQEADVALKTIRQNGRLPVIVGGTGLWLRALCRGLVELPPVDPEIRRRLRGQAAELGWPKLHERLRAQDAISANKIHENDGVRIERALEVLVQTGIALSEHHRRHALGGPRFDHHFVVVKRAREDLRQRIAERVQLMLRQRLIDEVRALRRTHPQARALGSVGYKEVCEWLDAEPYSNSTLDYAPLENAIKKSTWVYAKRQRTWFASEPGVDQILEVDAGLDRAVDTLLQTLAA